jgi:hypothetical protein
MGAGSLACWIRFADACVGSAWPSAPKRFTFGAAVSLQAGVVDRSALVGWGGAREEAATLAGGAEQGGGGCIAG